MLKKTIWLLVVGLMLAGSGVAQAQMDSKGLIIRLVDRLAYIDLGRRDGVQPGDLFDIVAPDVLADPLSGDTLAVSSQEVGVLRVLQVFDKMSIAELLHVQKGKDPLMMKIAPIDSADRLVDIEQYLQSPTYAGSGESRRLALIPGLYQLRSGHQRKGYSLMLAETASLVAGLGLRISSNDWKDRYDAYRGPDVDYLMTLGEGMQNRRRWSNRLFWLAGALYAYNWIDALWMQGGSTMEVQSRIPSRSPGLALELRVDPGAWTGLQVVHRF